MVVKSIPALVTPTVLKWARDQVRMEPVVAAKRAAVSEERLLSWEKGEARPTLRQARLLAGAYRQSLAALYLDERPTVRIHIPKDYRRLAGTLREALSTLIHLDVRSAWEKREIVLELMAAQDRKPVPFSTTLSLEGDPEVEGRELRQQLRVSLEEQSSWHDPRRAFNVLRARVEDLGVLVLQTSDVSLEELRAYSLHAEPLPVVVLNRKDVPAARIFSLMHELVHLALRSEGLCDLTTEVERTPEEQRLEVFCNAVAASCLIPRDALLGHAIVKQHTPGPVWTDTEIENLARFFSISREALLRRLLTFGLTNRKFYELKRKEYKEQYKNLPKPSGIVTPPVDALSLLGRPFVGLVLANLDSGRITTSDAADYLGLRLKHLPALVSSLAGD
jgi:Zn-dependent peptidase ImmA (M78 family)/DNA-binding XRE family transcriptional regulator